MRLSRRPRPLRRGDRLQPAAQHDQEPAGEKSRFQPEAAGAARFAPAHRHVPRRGPAAAGCIAGEGHGRRHAGADHRSHVLRVTSSWRWPSPQRAASVEKPLRDELLSIERLEERALALAASLTVDPDPRHRPRDTFPRFEDNVRVLRAAYRTLADDVRTGQFVVPAADWLLDNFHLVAAEIADIRRNLPRTYSRTLPALASREHAGTCAHLRHRRRADPPQRQPPRSPAAGPVPQQLSARRAADHRRAVGVAEHAQAGADREPAPAGRGAAGGRAPPAAPPTAT